MKQFTGCEDWAKCTNQQCTQCERARSLNWLQREYFNEKDDREPVKGPKSKRQEMFEERVLSLNADIAAYGANHPRVEPDVVCRAALQAVIDEEEAKR